MSLNPNLPVQGTFNRYQDVGVIGTIARPNIPFASDVKTVAIGEGTLIPGQAVFSLDGLTWTAVDNGTVDLATHILGFELTDLNEELVTSVDNQASKVDFPEESRAKGYFLGSIFVLAGATITTGTDLGYQVATEKWVPQSTFAVSGGDYRLLVRALTNAVDDQIMQVYVAPHIAST